MRREVQSVDNLDHAVLAVVGFQTLGQEIEVVLADTCTPPPIAFPERQTVEQLTEELDQFELEYGPSSALPAAGAAWQERQPALKRYASWLVYCCGLTQTGAAEFINASGHRTPQGRIWQQATVSALINGRYDRHAAA